jgi:hypothetical protein
MIQSVAVSAVNRGWTAEQFLAVMLRRSNRGTTKIFEKTPDAARAYLDGSWKRSSLSAATRPNPTVKTTGV